MARSHQTNDSSRHVFGLRSHVRKLIKPIVGGVKHSKLNALHVQGLYQSLASNGAFTAMQRQAGGTLRAALSWAVRLNLAANNPAKLVKMPAHRKAKVNVLEPGQIAAFLLAASSDRLSAIYPLAIDSGCRQGDLLALTWKDIDFGRGAVSVTKSLEEVEGRLSVMQPKTEKASRIIMLSAFSLDALQTHRKAMVAEGGYLGHSSPMLTLGTYAHVIEGSLASC